MAIDPLTIKVMNKMISGSELPAFPHVALRLLELSKNPENGPAEFAVPIESDPGMASQVLHFVNSSYFGFLREISTVKLAIAMVGIRTVKNYALWSAVFTTIPEPKCGGYDLKSSWCDSLTRALFARTVSRELQFNDTEAAFCGALLQDIAIPLLANGEPRVYGSLLAKRRTTGTRLHELERHSLGWTHADAGGMICRRWNLPEDLTVMVERHLDIDEFVDPVGAEAGAAAIALSALLPSSMDSDWKERDLFEYHYRRIMPSRTPEIIEVFREVDWQFAELGPALKLPTTKRTLREIYAEAVIA